MPPSRRWWPTRHRPVPAPASTSAAEARTRHGPIRALIHGAGVLEDRLIVDKRAEQFDRVFDTKVKGLLSLMAAMPEDDLRYIIFFSSVTARIGNKGQAA